MAKVSTNLRKDSSQGVCGVWRRSSQDFLGQPRQERGAIDTPENFARFYMHLILERAAGASNTEPLRLKLHSFALLSTASIEVEVEVVIYLDADTIVQVNGPKFLDCNLDTMKE